MLSGHGLENPVEALKYMYPITLWVVQGGIQLLDSKTVAQIHLTSMVTRGLFLDQTTEPLVLQRKAPVLPTEVSPV